MQWLRDWEFCRRLGCRERESAVHLQDRFSARQWLEPFKTDVSKMLTMRALLSQEFSSSDLSRMSDHDIVDRVGELLASGRLHLHASPTRIGLVREPSHASKPASAGGARTPTPYPLPERPPRTPAAVPFREPPVAEPSTFPPHVDYAAQAAVFVEGARSGQALVPI